MAGQPQGAPFPIFPSAIQICGILGALYPHFDIVDDKFIFQTGRLQLDRSLHALNLGACILLLGFYCCQFLAVLTPLRKEYLGALGLTQALHFLLLLARAAIFPDSLEADPAGTLLGLIAAACVSLLVVNENVAFPREPSAAASKSETTARARVAVDVATHALWLVFALLFVLPYLSSFLPLQVPSHMPYGLVAAVLTQVIALARLGLFISKRGVAGRYFKQKAA
ncbi:hypothetical protein Vretimale_19310 [Volvox reticuliferus]|uniref:Uncharacterized protein n=1 Tax=Volvox reticuliferus TaxID=1737510 RepID=A0A8J4GZ44_9CHLO|nr:hypothetical protein Vretifemale_20036 [Volvox reticuliferus]GIM16712.1 hypothetical protein Vretimale_19310 [Volvox reticuliferus]